MDQQPLTQDQILNWVVIIITVGAIGIGLLSMAVGRLARFVEWWQEGIEQARATRNMSSQRMYVEDDQPLYDDELPATTTPQNKQQSVATPQNDSNALLREQARVLALMVRTGKIGETDGIRLVFGCVPSSSNPKYLAARDALKTELKILDNSYPQRTHEQDVARKELGLKS